MQDYYKEEFKQEVKKQRNKTIMLTCLMIAVYIIISALFMWWHSTLVVQSPTMTVIKIIHYTITAVFVVALFIIVGIKFKRANNYYKKCIDIETGLTEESIGSFIEFDHSVQTKDGVEFKSAIFLEYKERKDDFCERKVLLFYDKSLPEFVEGVNIKYVTQGNVLKSYEIQE